MERIGQQVDSLFAARRGRREVLRWGVAASGAAAVAAVHGFTPAASQDATPAAVAESTMTMFVQAFHDGTWTAGAGAGTYTLTLNGGLASTIFFSDRPARVYGAAPTPDILDAIGFPTDNPPNAALVVNSDGVADILVIELFDPAYDEAGQTLTYTAKVLEAYHETGLEYLAVQQADQSLPQEFGAGALFIDDCADRRGYCVRYDAGKEFRSEDVWFGTCYHYGNGCTLCHDGVLDCNKWFPDQCEGRCHEALYY